MATKSKGEFVKVSGDTPQEMSIAIEAYTNAMVDTRTAALKFKEYILGKRLDNMFRNLGRIVGPYGAGTVRWAKNMPWVQGVKGHVRTLHSAKNMFKSSIRTGYQMTVKHAKSGRDLILTTYTFTNKREHAQYIHDGWRPHIVRARNASALKIPIGNAEPPEEMHAKLIGGKWYIFRKWVMAGGAVARFILGFVDGDLSWYGDWWMRTIETADKKAKISGGRRS